MYMAASRCLLPALKELFRFVHWPSWLLLWGALVVLRLKILEETGIEFASAWEKGLGLGFHADLVAALIPLVLAWLAWGVAGLPRRAGFTLFATLIWLVTGANALYFDHFGVSLDWWVLQYHLDDLTDIRGNVAQLAKAVKVAGSFLLFLAAVWLFFRREQRAARRRRTPATATWKATPWDVAWPFLKNRLLGTARALGILFLFFALQQLPRAFHIVSIGHPINSHVLSLWYQQNFKERPFSGLEKDIGRAYGRDLFAGRNRNPGLVLARFRDFRETHWITDGKEVAATEARRGSAAAQARAATGVESSAKPAAQQPGDAGSRSAALDSGPGTSPNGAASNGTAGGTGKNAGKDGDGEGGDAWPLLRQFNPSPERSRELRRMVGLPQQGAVHVILLLVEGARWYEINHPYAGPRIFPRIGRILKKHGIAFSQAYSSSATAGQTVRGTFSTYCSFLPNIKGPATYIAYSTIRVRCLPELMKENGYATLWFNSHRKNSHNKDFFEGTNGVDHFYDPVFFKERGVTERMGAWGLGDQPVLRETLKKIREWAQGDKPVYAQVVTVSTHLPAVAAPGVKFDDEFEAVLREDPGYRDFMSMFRYTDEAVGEFVEGLFESEMGGSTVVFLLGDHSNGSVPVKRLALTPLQQFDAQFRIPMAVLTRDMPKPEVRQRLVHHMDVAPTAARIAGIRGLVTWLGKGLFAPGAEGTPWVYAHRAEVYWRTQNRGCYAGKCYDLSAHDPMLRKNPPRLAPQSRLTRFFSSVIDAAGYAIGGNRISPVH